MGWVYGLYRTRDGESLARLTPISAGSWTRRLFYEGGGSHDFWVPSSPEDGLSLWGNITNAFPYNRLLVVSWQYADGTVHPVYAGAVQKMHYDATSRVLSLSHKDIWAIWRRRIITARHVAAQDPQARTMQMWVNLEPFDLQTWVKKIVEWGMRSTPPAYGVGELPIRLPAGERAGSAGRKYWSYEFMTVADALAEVPETHPEATVDFVPMFRRDGRFCWDLVVRTSPPGTVELNASAPGSAVTGLSVTHDMEDYLNDVNVTGKGSETAVPYWYHRVWGGDTPNRVLLMGHESRSELTDMQDLERATAGIFQERNRSVRQVECSVLVGGDSPVDPARLVLGSRVLMNVSDDPVIDGQLDSTLIGIRGAGHNAVRLELADNSVFQG